MSLLGRNDTSRRAAELIELRLAEIAAETLRLEKALMGLARTERRRARKPKDLTIRAEEEEEPRPQKSASPRRLSR